MFLIVYITIGIISGLLMGTVGIGGGVVLVPLLLATGLHLPQVVAVTLAMQAVPQTLGALYVYYKAGHVLVWPTVLVVLGSAAGSAVGAYVATRNYFSEQTLYRFMSALMVACAIYFIRK